MRFRFIALVVIIQRMPDFQTTALFYRVVGRLPKGTVFQLEFFR